MLQKRSCQQPKRDQRQPKPTDPSWLTSTPEPGATSPLPGMKQVPARTDQKVYACYDQERGVPCIPVPERPSIRPHPLADQVAAGQQSTTPKGRAWGRSSCASLAICWWSEG